MMLIAVVTGLALLVVVATITPPPKGQKSLIVEAWPCFEPAFPYRLAMQTAWSGTAPPHWFPSNVYITWGLNPNEPVSVFRIRQRCMASLNNAPRVHDTHSGFLTGLSDPGCGYAYNVVEAPSTQLASFALTDPAIHAHNVSHLVPVVAHNFQQDITQVSPTWYETCGWGVFNPPNHPIFRCDSHGNKYGKNVLGRHHRPLALASRCAQLAPGTRPGRLGAWMIFNRLCGGPPDNPIPPEQSGWSCVPHGLTIQDMPRANEYQWMVVTPVEPVEGYPWSPSPPPYPAGAHNQFIFEGPKTYEIPCIFSNSGKPQPVPPVLAGAFLNRAYKWFADELAANPEIPRPYSDDWIEANRGVQPHTARGLRAIVAYSSRDPRPGWLTWYCRPSTFWDTIIPGPVSLGSIVENMYRVYHGVTESKREVWLDDPLKRGWGVVEHAFVHGWFTQDVSWMILGDDPEPARWSAWYCGGVQIRITGGGDPDDPGFRSWILSRDSGFGVLFEPRYAVCNDVLAHCAGQPKALGDAVFPDHVTQVESYANIGGEIFPTPCQSRLVPEDSHSYRWRSALPCGPTEPGGPLNPGPHCGLYHQWTRRRFTMPDYSTWETQFGWAKLAFTTTPPILIAATP